MSFYDHFSETEIEVLRQRAARIASAQSEVEQGDVISALVIKAGGETYALPMEALAAVYTGHTVVPVPCVPTFVAGIANVRGQVLPVFDLAVILKAPSGGTRQVLIVASNADNSMAFCVEAVGDAEAILTSALQPLPNTLNGAY